MKGVSEAKYRLIIASIPVLFVFVFENIRKQPELNIYNTFLYISNECDCFHIQK